MDPTALAGQLAQYGLLGLLLAIVGWIAWSLLGQLRSSWEARIVDSAKMAQVIEANNTSLTAMALANENRAKAIDSLAQGQQAVATQVESCKREIEELRRIADRLALISERRP